MKKGWTTTKLITVGGLVALKLLVTVFFYTSFLAISGSVFSGISYVLIGPFFTVLVSLIIDQFGSVLIFSILRFIIELPLPSIFPEIVNFVFLLVIGLTIDSFYSKLKAKKQFFSFLSGFVYNFLNMMILVFLYFTIGVPAAENIPKIFEVPVVIMIITFLISIGGGFSGCLAFLVYGKIKNTSMVKRIQA